MERQINVYIEGNFVKKDSKNAGTKGESEVTTLHIILSSEWLSYSKRIIFRDAKGENPVTKLLFDSVSDIVFEKNPLEFTVSIPGEALKETGWCSFTVEGYKGGNDDEPIAVMISVTDCLFVRENDTAYMPAEPIDSEAKQLRILIAQAIEETGEIVKAAREDLKKAEEAAMFWGVWSAEKTYYPLQKVQNRGSSYICDRINTGIEPFFDVVDGKGNYWTLIAEKGDIGKQGPKGDRGAVGPEGPRGMNGIAVQTYGMVAFYVNEEGNLICRYTGEEAPNYYIGDDGHLYLEV